MTPELIVEFAKRLTQTRDLAALKAEYRNKYKFSGVTTNKLVQKAKEYIHEAVDELNDVQRDLNVLFLNEMIVDQNARREDKLKAVDMLNKMNSEYTQKVELTTDTKFILGGFEDNFLEQDVADDEVQQFVDESRKK